MTHDPSDKHLADLVADALEVSARTGALGPLHVVATTVARSRAAYPRTAAQRIWSLGFKEYVRRNTPEPPRPWWKRIWSIYSGIGG